MKAAVCDDEKSEQQILCKYVQEWAAEKGETAELNCFDNAESFLFSWEDDKEYTVLILDIEMGRICSLPDIRNTCPTVMTLPRCIIW